MLNPRLKPSFQLLPTERALVDRQGGAKFPLTQGQAHICFLLDGSRSPTELRAECRNRGVDVQVADIERQIAFLRSLGAVEDVPPPGAKVAPPSSPAVVALPGAAPAPPLPVQPMMSAPMPSRAAALA